MKIGIIGCGLIGAKRARALAGGRLVACADPDLARAERLAGDFGIDSYDDYRPLLERADIDLVVVAAVHSALAPLTQAAVEAGKHVLVEKPGARHYRELDPVIEAAARAGVLVRVGFNHRYHPALLKARALVDEGAVGELMFLRARYGHGGRIGYDKEWRARPEISGGGELIDQGMHLVDLARWFLGDFPRVEGFAHTFYWDMPVDDNAFLLLRTACDQVAWLHASCTEWKNTFSMEIYGRDGKLDISGLGGSYGVERLTHYRMLPEMGPPETTAWEYPRGDRSWELEMAEFAEDIRLGRQPSPGLHDARAALAIVARIYEVSRS